jgi:mannose-6-phosphate isomerase class I
MHILDPVIIEKPWGVRPHLIRWSTGIGVDRRNLVGELWIATGLRSLPDMTNTVHNAANGVTIADIVEKNAERFLGYRSSRPEELCGKTEAWYVRDVKGDVRTITGLHQGIGKKEFVGLINDGYFEMPHDFEELEKEVFTSERFERNAFYVMLPGTLHTIYAPDRESYIVIDELQQGYGDNSLPILSKILFVSNSELSVQVHPSDEDVAREKREEILQQYATEPTVRVYDFGRGRRSQPELAAELIRYDRKGYIRTDPIVIESGPGCKVTYLGATQYFAREMIEVRRGHECTAPALRGKYFILHCIDGEFLLNWKGGELRIQRGFTVAVPAWVESLRLSTGSGCMFYRDYVPNLEALKSTLRGYGVDDERMARTVIQSD